MNLWPQKSKVQALLKQIPSIATFGHRSRIWLDGDLHVYSATLTALVNVIEDVLLASHSLKYGQFTVAKMFFALGFRSFFYPLISLTVF